MGKKRQASSSSEDEGDAFLSRQSKPRLIMKEVQIMEGHAPSPRVNASFCWCPPLRKVLLFGGEYFDGIHTRFYEDLYLLDPKTGAWSKVICPRMPGPRSSHQMVWVEDRFWMFGGELSTRKETRFLHYRELWSLNPATWEWKLHEVVGPSARSGHRLVAHGGFAYLFGGFQDAGQGSPVYLDDLWRLDTAKCKWNRLENAYLAANRPTARSAFVFLPQADNLVLYGGYTKVAGEGEGRVLHDLWTLKLADGEEEIRWDRRKPSGITARSGCVGVAGMAQPQQQRLVVMGGVQDETISDEFLHGHCLADFYRLEGHRFLPLGQLDICPRYNAMLTAISDNELLLYGGLWECGDDQYTLSDLHLLSLAGDEITVKKTLLEEPGEARNWRTMKPTMDSSEDDSDSEDDESECSEEEEDDDEGDEDKDDEYMPAERVPSKKGCKTLKDYFDQHVDHWFNQALCILPNSSEKEQRAQAFAMAKQHWDRLTLAERLEDGL